ncbi:MAG: methionine--tRNA ligase [Lachnospiraceae bacterium]|nr:methionine--tRNA ligase [Lachnospiraceae bacterium]
MSDKGRYYITTAIAYASGKPHIGNTYEIILADAIARYKRQEGYDVHFQTGTDEHGQKIQDRAEAAGMEPKAFVDQVAGGIREVFDKMNTSYDHFIRTTDDYHEKQIQKIFRKMHDKGDIYLGEYKGMYCKECESFYTESQLVDGKCPLDGCDVEPASEPAYFFKMSKYADRLIEHINTHPEFIQPESRKNEMMNNFLLPGLQDLCVSRTSFSWGVPIDFAPGHVSYVWLDALANYITGIGYDADGNHGEDFLKYWPADLHLIGKDIIRFHTIYWPIFLMSLDLPLPKQVFGHPWLLQSGGKMSKSKGNVIYADDLADIFSVDAVRYFCIHEMPFENDGVISYDLMVERWNSELANTMGNLVNRTIAMTNKYFDGKIALSADPEQNEFDRDLRALIAGTRDKVTAKMDELRVADALTEVFVLFKRCNKYIDETEPWKLAKDESEKERLMVVLYNLLDGIETGATLLSSFMPETAERILAQIGAGMIPYDDLNHAGNYPRENAVTDAPEILFARLKLEEVMERIDAQRKEKGLPSLAELEAQAKAEAEAAAAEKVVTDSREEAARAADGEGNGSEAGALEHKELCTYDDFAKCEFRVGEIIACEEVKKSKKLLCSQVNLGDKTVQILSGLRPHYTPEQMIGKKVMVIENLAPRKMAGLESQGMILAAEGPDGTISLMVPEKQELPGGSEIN